MSRVEQAIEYIKRYRELDEKLYNTVPKGTVSSIATKKCLEFWDMAISALEQMSEKNCETCKYYDVFSLECGRCDDAMTLYTPKQTVKVGTKVRTTKDEDYGGEKVFPIGTIGIVERIDKDDYLPYKIVANNEHWYYSRDMFEVMEDDAVSQKPTCIDCIHNPVCCEIGSWDDDYTENCKYFLPEKQTGDAVSREGCAIGYPDELGNYDCGADFQCSDCPNWIKLPSVTQKSGWISVSERLPEDRQEILFSTKTDRVYCGRYYLDKTCQNWYSFKDEMFAYDNAVIAWMPLPEPYKEEGAE